MGRLLPARAQISGGGREESVQNKAPAPVPPQCWCRVLAANEGVSLNLISFEGHGRPVEEDFWGDLFIFPTQF